MAGGTELASADFAVLPGSYALVRDVPLTGATALADADLVLTYGGRGGRQVQTRVALRDLADLGLR